MGNCTDVVFCVQDWRVTASGKAIPPWVPRVQGCDAYPREVDVPKPSTIWSQGGSRGGRCGVPTMELTAREQALFANDF